ncbi:hypothetical protein [Bradyrhizobium sp.]|uniref:hypothetical protein n=1 Tax=Bradyrhizobium sp. TaxID=376 RepID=UPI003BAE4A84
MNPEIEVRAPAELNCKINFGGSEHDVEPCQYANRARLNATYFPKSSNVCSLVAQEVGGKLALPTLYYTEQLTPIRRG